MNRETAYQYAKRRDERFIEFVMNDDKTKLLYLLNDYGVGYPDDETVFRLSIYKRVQECENIDLTVKKTAAVKAMAMGFDIGFDFAGYFKEVENVR